MKATIEKSLDYQNAPDYEKMLRQLGLIIDIISISKTRIELADNLKEHERTDGIDIYFEYGFGGSHFWVNQKGNNNRLIFVEL